MVDDIDGDGANTTWGGNGMHGGDSRNRKDNGSGTPPSGQGGGDLVSGPGKDETNIDPDDPAIPSGHELAEAAQRALDDEVAFILLHQDDPDVFVHRLDRLLERMRAAMTVTGPHQVRAIRTVLRVSAHHWIAARRFDEWGRVLNVAYSRARDFRDPQLIAEVIAEWGTYYTLKHRVDSAKIAYEWSADKLDEAALTAASGDTRRLLLDIDRLNIAVTTDDLTREEIMDRADDLLRRARMFESTYFQGRIYHTLARYFRFVKRDHERAFMYGQMALCNYLPAPEDWGLVAQLLTTLIAALDIDQTGTWTYRQRLLAYLDEIVVWHYSFNPWLRARALQTHAVQHYHQGNADTARRFGLHAWWLHWRFGEYYSCTTTQHLIALAERDMGRWKLAERHLSDVLRQYDARGDAYNYMLAHFSRAMISVLQQDWERAEERLQESREIAEQRLRDPDQRKRISAKIDEQLAVVRQHLGTSHPR